MSNLETSFRVWDCARLLKVQCPWTWNALEKSSDTNVRHCHSCHKDVYLCRSPADFVAHGEQGHCVAIPDDLGPGIGLGEPSPTEVLRWKRLADRGASWWKDVVELQASRGVESTEAVNIALKNSAEINTLYNEEHLALMRVAVQLDGIRCPQCSVDLAEDYFGVVILLATKQCIYCQTPIDWEQMLVSSSTESLETK